MSHGTAIAAIAFGLTDHLEGPRERPSFDVFAEAAARVRLADSLGFDYFWFAEHHAHAHHGHLPAPLLLALHLAGQTRRIRLGTAVICLNLHHPLAVAEQVAVADWLAGGRLCVGFGSGSTPEEFALFGRREPDKAVRHANFEEALRVILAAWGGEVRDEGSWSSGGPPHAPLPVAAEDLPARSWLASNSVGAARIAGRLGFNALFSHLRTPEQYRTYAEAYRAGGGRGRIAANRPVYVGRDDETAFAQAGPALRSLWRRFRREGKIPEATPEPAGVADLCAHPINFVVGGPDSVARQLAELHAACPYDVINFEPVWDGLPEPLVHDCMRRLAEEVRPRSRRRTHDFAVSRTPSTGTPGEGGGEGQGDCGFRIAECGLNEANREARSSNPQSEIRIPQSETLTLSLSRSTGRGDRRPEPVAIPARDILTGR